MQIKIGSASGDEPNLHTAKSRKTSDLDYVDEVFFLQDAQFRIERRIAHGQNLQSRQNRVIRTEHGHNRNPARYVK